jgi:hypothetical protein
MYVIGDKMTKQIQAVQLTQKIPGTGLAGFF